MVQRRAQLCLQEITKVGPLASEPVPVGLTLPDVPVGDGRIPCPDCDRSFTGMHHLARHRQAKHRVEV